MSDRGKKIYLLVMIIVPFLIYCGYYYSEMIRKAPFKFVEFKTLLIDFKAPDGRTSSIDIGKGTVRYTLSDHSVVNDTLHFSEAELQEFHRTLYTNNFYDLPHEMRNEGSKDTTTGLYHLKAVYERKSYDVVYETNYVGNKRWKDKLNQIIKYTETQLKKKSGNR